MLLAYLFEYRDGVYLKRHPLSMRELSCQEEETRREDKNKTFSRSYYGSFICHCAFCINHESCFRELRSRMHEAACLIREVAAHT